MTPSLSRQRWLAIEPLLDAALDLEPSARSAFLDDVCSSDPTLRGELEALLASCDRGDDLLTVPAAVAYGPLLAESSPRLPALLGGRYRIVREIGRGGMASVYLADDLKHGRQVAVKALRSEVAHLIGRGRFAREIEIAASLSHPHILPLHDSGEVPSEEPTEPPLLYFVSPFAEGESVRDRLRRETRIEPLEAVRLGGEIALALDYAHRRGVIHLDIKPGNILLQEGHAVIADFGIARAASHASDDAVAGTLPILGTPSYMSPEQAQGLPDIDGRSDVYSLGCVLYEMITGERPLSRAATNDALAIARAPAAPDPAELLLYISRELASVIVRAMAPSRDERFATAAEFANALAGASPARLSRGWRIAGAAGIVAVLATASLLGARAVRQANMLDPDLVAVAPFDVASPSLVLWKEGLVDVISRSLDGAGALRAVPASVVVHRWTGRADARSARALGEATGARLVLYGGLVAAGDSVRAVASLYDVKEGKSILELEQRDVPDRIDRLSDSLAVAVMREIGKARGIDIAHATSSPTMSLGALKAYLQGEQFYRAALWDSAQARFERALELDSTYALAYHRLAAVLRWRDTKDIPDSAAYVLMRQPARFPRGLGQRERLLASIDSLSAETYFAWLHGLRDPYHAPEEQLFRRLCDALLDAMRRYPNDPELTFLHAEARARYDGDMMPGEIDDRATLARYDRAIALDSTLAPAYVRPIALAAYLDGAPSARRYTRAYLALAPTGPQSQIIGLTDALLDPARAPAVDMARLVDTSSADALCVVSTTLRHASDSAEIGVRFARAMLVRSAGSRPDPTAAACAVTNAVDQLQFRGHLREAFALSSSGAHWLRAGLVFNLARAGIVPADSARDEFRRVLSRSSKSTMTKLYRWWAADGDTASIRSYLDVFTAAERRQRTAGDLSRLRADVAAGRAFLALGQRDTVSAIVQLATTRDTLDECWYDNRMALVELLVATGQYHQAEQHLERRWPGTTSCSNGFDDVDWTMERARVFDRLGKRAEAAAAYALVADAWRTADPELQPVVREARAALARIAAPSAE